MLMKENYVSFWQPVIKLQKKLTLFQFTKLIQPSLLKTLFSRPHILHWIIWSPRFKHPRILKEGAPPFASNFLNVDGAGKMQPSRCWAVSPSSPHQHREIDLVSFGIAHTIIWNGTLCPSLI